MKKLFAFMLCSFVLFGCGSNKPDEIAEIEKSLKDNGYEISIEKDGMKNVFITGEKDSYMMFYDDDIVNSSMYSSNSIAENNRSGFVIYYPEDRMNRGMITSDEEQQPVCSYNLTFDKEDDFYTDNSECYDNDIEALEAIQKLKELSLIKLDLNEDDLIKYVEWYIENN